MVLVHGSVSGNRQWLTLTEALKDRNRVLAINLFGCGQTRRIDAFGDGTSVSAWVIDKGKPLSTRVP